MPTPRVALAQIDTTVGDFAGNAARIREATRLARSAGARLVAFPELALCGDPPRDLLDLREFLDRAARALAELAQPAEWSRGMALAIGFPEAAPDAPPPGVYDAVALVEGGRVTAVGRKSLLPSYDVLDETRHFLPASSSTTAFSAALDLRLGLSVCEDVWNDKRLRLEPRDARDPVAELRAGGADLVLNASASPYGLGKPRLRERMVGSSAAGHGVALAYVNQVGGNDALIFDGGSMLVGARGEVLARAPLFEEVVLTVNLDGGAPEVQRLPGAGPLPAHDGPDPAADEVYRALVLGLRDYARKCGYLAAVVGLSGSVDSALTACLAADALGPTRVLGVAMPSRSTPSGAREDAAALARDLGVRFREIPIEPVHAACLAQLEAALGHPLRDLASRNAQARIRGQLLVALADEEGSLCLSAVNKSELAVGSCALYGDMAGGLAVLGDLPRTLVHRVARAANARAGRELVPERTLVRPPPADREPGQAEADRLPPDEALDDVLAAYVEDRLTFGQIVARGHAPEVVERVLRRVVTSEHKRRQAAPVLKVTARAFGEGRRLPIAHGWRHGGPAR